MRGFFYERHIPISFADTGNGMPDIFNIYSYYYKFSPKESFNFDTFCAMVKYCNDKFEAGEKVYVTILADEFGLTKLQAKSFAKMFR